MPPDLQTVAIRLQGFLSERANPILLVGSVGTGKSTTAALVASAWPNWRFVSCAELLSDIMQARTSPSRSIERRTADGRRKQYTESQLLDEMCSVPMLVLDDVGTAELTSPQEVVLLQLVNRRLADPQYRPLLITTNTNESSLYAAVGNRIGSRLCRTEGEVIKLTGSDRRRQARTV
jgi:DNA replication protein DnaC